MGESYAQTLVRLRSAQKGAARSAPAYSRFVNRRIGSVLAAWAVRVGLSPNQVTGVSAVFTFAGVAALLVLRESAAVGFLVACLLVLGYAFDSADGQVARLTGASSAAGEWLDHIVDSVKVVAVPLSLGVYVYRAGVEPELWLVVPLVAAVVGSVQFFGMMLTEQLRRAYGVVSRARTDGRAPWLRSVLVLPTDYGVLCWTFVLLGWLQLFLWLYAAITVATVAFLCLALPKWHADVAALGQRPQP